MVLTSLVTPQTGLCSCRSKEGEEELRSYFKSYFRYSFRKRGSGNPSFCPSLRLTLDPCQVTVHGTRSTYGSLAHSTPALFGLFIVGGGGAVSPLRSHLSALSLSSAPLVIFDRVVKELFSGAGGAVSPRERRIQETPLRSAHGRARA